MKRLASPSLLVLFLLAVSLLSGCEARAAAGIFIRVKVIEPQSDTYNIAIGGHIHVDPWSFPGKNAKSKGGEWSEWVDLNNWKWHGRMNREGGIAEWPSVKVTINPGKTATPATGCEVQVQLAEAADEAAVVHDFKEKSESRTIGFLVPNPLREHAKEFETGSQMTARHLKWAQEASGGKAPVLKQFNLITSLWGHYDPALARQALATLKLLGFNVAGGAPTEVIQGAGMKTYSHSWMYGADPEKVEAEWKRDSARVLKEMATPEGKWRYDNSTHWVLSDEISALGFKGVDAAKRNGWFRDYLKQQGVTAAELGKPIEEAELPADALVAPTFPREADLPTRRLHYYAAKFTHWWSAKQLRMSSDLVQSTLPQMKTETLPTDHGFFYAWEPPNMGMSYKLLDLFELGAQRSVDQLSAEDWMGLNHMYGPNYTWTGAQTFEYFNALVRSSIQLAPGGKPMEQRSLITPSDDNYLRLKAYSAIGQGTKSIFYWTYGPTYIGTENYWSDLRSQYDGVAKVSRALAKAETVLAPAQPVRDPVAILYSVSHDLWHTDDPAAFVEKRLLWHALRHLQVQPDFLREESIEAGQLKNYKVLYIADWCVSRKASAAIDQWVRDGGVLYLSGGAATRDEFYEPYVPPYAAAIWPADAATALVSQARQALKDSAGGKPKYIKYNERRDLPKQEPLTKVKVNLGQPFELPVLGARVALHPDLQSTLATYDDGSTAAASLAHGKGRVIGLGFLPMLAYGQGANFPPTTLGEKWPMQPRQLIQLPLMLGRVQVAAKASLPVVETSLLNGPNGAVLVLANYTYEPIASLSVDVMLKVPVKRAVSTEGKPLRMQKIPGGVRLQLPLEWTDMVLLTSK